MSNKNKLKGGIDKLLSPTSPSETNKVSKLTPMTVQIPEELHRSLKMRAVQEGKKIRDVVISLLEEYLKE